MGDLKTQNTNYPSQLDTATALQDDVDEIVSQLINGPNSAIIAIESELGIGVKGTAADLAARLAVNLADDGGILSGNDFPGSPPLKPHFFYHNGTKLFYTFDVSTASYIAISTVAVLSSYVRKGVADTITAAHTFAPLVPGVPFALGANAQGYKVTGLNADQVDGIHATASATSTSIPVSNAGGKLDIGWLPTAVASGLATLDANSLVVQNPVNATSTAAISKIPISNTSGKLEAGWGGDASTLATLDANTRLAQVANTLWDSVAGRSASPTAGASQVVVSGTDGYISPDYLGASGSTYKLLRYDKTWADGHGIVVYSASGSFTFTSPITANGYVLVVGGGGGGGGGGGSNSGTLGGGGGGGGASGQIIQRSVSLVAGTSYSIVVGAGGTYGGGGANGNNGVTGTAGTTSSFGAIVAAGGGNGIRGLGSGTGTGGAGGTVTQFNSTSGTGGSNGTTSDIVSTFGDGGRGADRNGTTGGGGGGGGNNMYAAGGDGGNGGTSVNNGAVGQDAAVIGGGGGGGGGGGAYVSGTAGGHGGSGCDGLVVIWW